MDAIKEFKRGEIILKEGVVTDFVYLIQSGRVKAYLERSGKKIELENLSTGQLVGEQAVWGVPKMLFTAEAETACKALVIPVKVLSALNEAAAPGLKLFIRSITEGLKKTRASIRSLKMEMDSSPCPQILVPKLFSLFVLLGNHIGKKEEGKVRIPWQTLKMYSSRVFLESPKRMQSGLELLKKLGLVEMIIAKNEEGEDELTEIHFLNLQLVEDFGEFFQYHLYKPGRSEAIYVDEIALKVVKGLVDLSAELEVNHKGAVVIPYDNVLKYFKQRYQLEIKNTHWDLLEKKGLFVDRKSNDDGLFLLFDKKEFAENLIYWTILFEIEKWNEFGYVNMRIQAEEVMANSDILCSGCQEPISGDQKFCHNCGEKLAA